MTEGAGPQTLIEVTEVSRIFSRRGVDTRAVDGVSCRMTAGRDLGIVGESGSGKTTLARIIMGLETATAGTVRVLGEDLTRPARRQRERLRRARMVQMVYQDPYGSLDPRSTARACLDEVLRLHPPADGTSRPGRTHHHKGQTDRGGHRCGNPAIHRHHRADSAALLRRQDRG